MSGRTIKKNTMNIFPPHALSQWRNVVEWCPTAESKWRPTKRNICKKLPLVWPSPKAFCTPSLFSRQLNAKIFRYAKRKVPSIGLGLIFRILGPTASLLTAILRITASTMSTPREPARWSSSSSVKASTFNLFELYLLIIDQQEIHSINFKLELILNIIKKLKIK